MTSKEVIKKFELRLDNDYLKKFQNGKLLKPGKVLEWQNLNGSRKITIAHFDGLKVTFCYLEKGEIKVEIFTLDNFYIYNKKHIQSLVNRSREYDSETFHLKNIPYYKGAYIIRNRKNNKFYVGQAKHIMWRMKDHLKGDPQNAIDKVIQAGNPFTLRTIPFSGSAYKNLNALETALIAYFNSYHMGYNATRGNNGPGNRRVTAGIKYVPSRKEW